MTDGYVLIMVPGTVLSQNICDIYRSVILVIGFYFLPCYWEWTELIYQEIFP